jgi:ParB/RepB/Spo0J family partition protein
VSLASVTREFREIPLALIDEPVLASRSSMDEPQMDSLVASIRDNGLINPISVARVGERYEVIAGHRRRIACGRAGMAVAACIVYPSKDIRLEAIKVAENADREEWSAADEAIYFSELLEQECGGDIERLCALVNRKLNYVDGRIGLFQGDPEVFAQLQRGTINIGVAQQLNRCTDPLHRRYLLDQAIHSQPTVATASGWIAEWKRDHEPATRNSVAIGPPVTSGVAVARDYMTCACCGLTEHPADMRPLQVHSYCEQAILRPALKFFTHRHDFLARPRTLADAQDLVSDLVDHFPALAGEPTGDT